MQAIRSTRADRRLQQQERLAEVADDELREGLQPHTRPARVGVGMSGPQARDDRIEIFPRGLRPDPRFHDAEDAQEGRAAPGPPRIRLQDEGRHELRARRQKRVLRGEDADDRVGLAVQRQDVAEDAAVAAEARLPEPVGEEGDARASRPFLFRHRRAPERRAGAQDSEEVARHPLGRQRDGLVDAGQVGAPSAVREESVEASGVLAELEEVRDREGLPVAPGLERVDREEPLGVREGEPAQEHGADDREDRGVGADRQGEGRYDGGGEARAPADVAEGEAKVAQEARHHGGISTCASVGVAYNIINDDFM